MSARIGGCRRARTNRGKLSMQTYVMTATSAEVPMAPMNRKRGIRFWRGAEMSTSVWFLLEACVDQRADIEIRSFVTPDLEYAAWLEKSLSHLRWSRVSVFMRFQDVTKQNLTYHDLNLAYRSKSTGAHIFHLATGHVVAEPGLPNLDGEEAQNDMVLVYQAPGAGAELHCYP